MSMRKTKSEPIDIYRNSKVRYLGYAHVLGNAIEPYSSYLFRSITYALSITYVCGNVFEKCSKSNDSIKHINQTAGDILLWHTFATLWIPGVIVRNLQSYSYFVLCKTKVFKKSSAAFKLLPTVICLASIPIFSRPLDVITDEVMNKTYRAWLNNKE